MGKVLGWSKILKYDVRMSMYQIFKIWIPIIVQRFSTDLLESKWEKYIENNAFFMTPGFI